MAPLLGYLKQWWRCCNLDRLKKCYLGLTKEGVPKIFPPMSQMTAVPTSLLICILGSPISSTIGLGQNWEDKCINGMHRTPQKRIPYAFAYPILSARFDQYLWQTDYYFQVLTAQKKHLRGQGCSFQCGWLHKPQTCLAGVTLQVSICLVQFHHLWQQYVMFREGVSAACCALIQRLHSLID